MQFVCKTMVLGDVGREVFAASCATSTAQSTALDLVPLVGAASGEGGHDYDALGAFIKGTEWKEKCGSRVRIVREHLFVSTAHGPIVLKTFVLTALEELSTFFLYAKWRRTHDEVPLMYDLTWPSHSPIVLAQQFLSTGLAAERRAGRPKASWVKVFLAILKVHSFQALSRTTPAEALLFRRSVIAASTSV